MTIVGEIDLARNKPKVLSLTCTNGSGTAYDLTGKTVWFTVKRTIDDDLTDAAAVITKSQSSHTNPSGGLTTVTINAVDTSTLTAGKYFYDIQIGTGTANIVWSGNGTLILDRPTKNLPS